MRLLCNHPLPHQLGDAVEFLVFGKGPHCQYPWNRDRPLSEVVIQAQADGPIDGLLFWLGEVYSLPEGIEDCPVPTAVYISDWNLNGVAAWVAPLFFDHVLCDLRGVELFTQRGFSAAWWNPYDLYSDRFPTPDPRASRPLDVVFIGNMNPGAQKERGPWVRRLLSLNKKYRIQVEANLRGGAYVQALGSAKVVFNHSIRGEANIRVFESVFSGALCFLEQGNREIGHFLQDGAECLLYPEAHMEFTLESILGQPQQLKALTEAAHDRLPYLGRRACLTRLAKALSPLLSQPFASPRAATKLNQAQRAALRLGHAQYCQHHCGDAPNSAAELETLFRQSPCREAGQALLCAYAFQKVLDKPRIDFANSLGEQLLDKNPDDVWTRFNLAQVHVKNSTPQANALLDEIHSGANSAIGPGRIHGFPASNFAQHEYHHDLHACWWNQQQGGTFPRHPNLQNWLRFWAHYQQGLVLCSPQHCSSEAVPAFVQAVEAYGDDAHCWQLLGACLPPGHPLRLSSLKRSAQINPLRPKYLLEVAKEHLHIGQGPEALRILEESKSLAHLWPNTYAMDADAIAQTAATQELLAQQARALMGKSQSAPQ